MSEEERKVKEKAKKQVPLRLSASLWNDLAAWAEDHFRSINGQIEYLLTECVNTGKDFLQRMIRSRYGRRSSDSFMNGGRCIFCVSSV